MDEKVTLRSIADIAGVSTMTVSRALRGDKSISEQTRSKIVAIANKIGYRNSALVSLVMGHLRRGGNTGLSSNLGFLCGSIEASGWKKNPYYQRILEGAQEQAQHYGCNLDIIWIREAGLSEQRLGDILENRGIRGIILGTWEGGLNTIKLNWEKFFGIAIGYSIKAPLHRVASNQYQSMHLALDRMRELGYRRIGAIFSDFADHRVNLAWSGSYYAHMMRQPSSVRLAPLLLDKPHLHNINDFHKWYKKEKPDAVIVQGGTFRKLRSSGIEIPQQLAAASLESDSEKDPVAGITRNFNQIGATAVDLLVSGMLSRSKNTNNPLGNTFINSTWNDGATAPPKSGTPRE